MYIMFATIVRAQIQIKAKTWDLSQTYTQYIAVAFTKTLNRSWNVLGRGEANWVVGGEGLIICQTKHTYPLNFQKWYLWR